MKKTYLWQLKYPDGTIRAVAIRDFDKEAAVKQLQEVLWNEFGGLKQEKYYRKAIKTLSAPKVLDDSFSIILKGK